VSTNRTKTIVALGVALLTGCEAIAGIKDITPSDDGGPGSSDATTTPSGDGAQGEAESSVGGDAAPPSDAAQADGGDAGAVDGRPTGDTGAAIDAGDASQAVDATDARVDAPTEAGSADANGLGDVASGDGPGGGGPGDGPAEAASNDAASSDGAAGTDAGGPPDGDIVAPDGAFVAVELIDNMESDTGGIALSNGRDGFWHVYDDGTDGGVLTPAPGGLPSGIISAISPPRGASTLAAHMQGSGFAMFAGMGFDMVDSAGSKQLYDASAFRGFTFWARSATATTTPLTVRMLVPDVNTDSAGGVCTVCGDNFGANLSLTTAWQEFFVDYTQLTQIGFGVPNGSQDGGPKALAASQMYGVQFQVSAPASAPAFDVWVDDIQFIK